jgi:hypothetical protein
MFKSLVFLAGFGSVALAATVKYDWDITWVNAAPDGVVRPVIGKLMGDLIPLVGGSII